MLTLTGMLTSPVWLQVRDACVCYYVNTYTVATGLQMLNNILKHYFHAGMHIEKFKASIPKAISV